jgi:hypothetical protein
MHSPSYRRTGVQKIVGSGESGPFRRPTQLCQVGTPTGDRPIQIQLPESEGATEIEDRYPQTSIWWHESAPSPKNQPRLTMGGEDVKGPLKPISTATSDEQVRQTTDSESSPGSQIYALVDLRLTIFPNTPEVLFKIRRSVQHEKTHPREIWHAVCLLI